MLSGGRVVQIHSHATREEALKADPDDFVFKTTRGRPIRHNLFYKRRYKPAVRAALAAAAHDHRFHDLRHTAASLAIAQGANLLQLMKRLGHEDIRTTMNTYGHLYPSEEVALGDALDQLAQEVANSGNLQAIDAQATR